MTVKVIIDKELLDNFSQFDRCNNKTKFLELYPDGLDVSGLWAETEARKATWERLLTDGTLRLLVGYAIDAGVIPVRIIGSFSNTNLRYANLRNASLRNADLRYANLRYANLRNASLRNADLTGADLEDADLSDANLRSANLSGANLSGANLNNIITNKLTIMPKMPKGWTK